MDPQLIPDLHKFYPEIILTAAFLLAIIGDLGFSRIRGGLTFSVAALGLALAFAAGIPLFGMPTGTLFFGVIAIDPLAAFFKCFLILTSFLVLLATPGSRELSQRPLGEFYMLLLGVTLSMVLLASS
ncbi:MAG: proton-translocating NADH-quinone oxidoreductase, chain, partial [Acidobacteria bacterium]|nr:proton-translocating NADH-quinone oxidoreductase, chain [Acidobacteriota bacterium]